MSKIRYSNFLPQEALVAFPDFAWFIPEAGFKWIRCRILLKEHDGADECLLPLPPAGEGRSYFPDTDQPGLFRVFAELKADDLDGYRNFANKYGRLGIGYKLDPKTVPAELRAGHASLGGEP